MSKFNIKSNKIQTYLIGLMIRMCKTNLSLELLSCGLIALVLNEDVKFVAFGFGDVDEANEEDELIVTGATAILDGAAIDEFAVDACDNWA